MAERVLRPNDIDIWAYVNDKGQIVVRFQSEYGQCVAGEYGIPLTEGEATMDFGTFTSFSKTLCGQNLVVFFDDGSNQH